MPTSPKPDAISILASLAEASNRPPNKPPETDETKPRPWQAPPLVAESESEFAARVSDLDVIPWD
jgi:hypothetical protein